MSLNKVMLIGNLGQDPKTKEYEGTTFCNFSIATNMKWKDKRSGEMKEDVQWHNIAVAGPQAAACGKYLTKGRQVFVEGSLRTRKYQDKETGQDKYFTEVRADRVQFLQGGSQETGSDVESGSDGDVPF